MKKRTIKIFTLLLIICLSASTALFAACISSEKGYTPSDKTEYIRNPDCGFYQPISFACKQEGINYSLKNYLTRNNLMHLRMDLSSFVGSELSQETLSDLHKMLGELRQNSVNAIIRFAYDKFNGEENKEPSMSLLLRHVEQLGGVLKEYNDVLTAVEAGMIGPWGEMHTSSLAIKENFNKLLQAWLENTHPLTPILARRPRMVADYLGVDIGKIDEHVSVVGTPAYRLGVFNDGYLGSSTDLGTYKNRKKEIDWLTKQAAHTPFGGEVTVPGSEYNKIEHAAKEMFLTHTSYLNELWNDRVVAEWKDTEYTINAGDDTKYHGRTAYEYIRDHLGYRFTVSDILLSQKAREGLRLSFDIKNDGFGNLLKSKTCELIFINNEDKQSYIEEIDINPKMWLTGKTYSMDLKINTRLKEGEYTVLLRLREPDFSAPIYCVAFANGEFNNEFLANTLGTIKI